MKYNFKFTPFLLAARIANADQITVRSSITSAAPTLLSNFISDATFESNLLEHGCWCAKLDPTAIQAVLGGKVPSDDLDDICKKWISTRSCTGIPGNSCNLIDVRDPNHEYIITFTAGHFVNTASCASNSDQCLFDMCQVDLYFVNQILTHYNDNNYATNVFTPITASSCSVYDNTGSHSGSHAHCDVLDTITEISCSMGDNYIPAAGDFATGDQRTAFSEYIHIPSNFIRSEIGGILLNKFQNAGFKFSLLSGVRRVNYCTICTSDNHEIRTNDNLYFQYNNVNSPRFCDGQNLAGNDGVLACHANQCNVDWSSVTSDDLYANEYCGNVDKVMNGIYMKESVYNSFSSCNYVAVRNFVQSRNILLEARE